jgi:3-hydroxyisobutyrate dehydrogenase
MTKIGYLGGGRMAQAMVSRLLPAGHQVTIYNRTLDKVRNLERAGARLAATPREAAEGAEIVIASVTDEAASRAVWTGADGALGAELAPGAIIVEHSTLPHGWVLELCRAVRARGLRYVDCPVAGRPDAAAAGQLAIFAGCDPADLEAIRPLIEPLSKEIFLFGPPGTGTAFKLIYNVLGVVQIVGLAEALSAAEAAGIDLTTAARAIANGNTGSGHVRKHGPFMAEGVHEDPPGFTAGGRIKDLTYGIGLEEALGEDPLVGRAALAAYRHMVDLGMPDSADSMVIDCVRKRRKPGAAKA